MTSVPRLPLRHQAAWVVGCRVVGIAATLASNILAARLLGPAQFGTYLVVTVVIALGGLLGMAGLNEAALRFVAESLALGRPELARSYVRRALEITALASLCAALAIAGGVAIYSLAMGNSQSILFPLLVAAGIILLAWQQLGAELIRAHGELRLASLFSGGQAGGPLSNLLFLVGLCSAALVLPQVGALAAAGIVVASLIVTCPLVYLGLWRTMCARSVDSSANMAPLSRQQGTELLAVGGALLTNQLLAFVTLQLDIWLAGGLLTHEALGLYGAAKRSLLVAAMPVQMAMLTVLSLIPQLNAQRRTAELERLVRRAATAAAIPALLALIALTIFPRQVLAIVLGGSYTGAATTLIVLALGHYVLVLAGNPQHVLTMTGRHRLVLIVNVISAVVLVSAGTAGAIALGAPGLAIGSSAGLAVQNVLLWWLARRELGIWTHVGLINHQPGGSNDETAGNSTTVCEQLSAPFDSSPASASTPAYTR